MFVSLVQITWWDFIWAVNLLNSVHFHRAHYFLRVSSMTSHQRFKSIGEVFLMTFLHGNFLMFDIRVSILTIHQLRVSMYRKRTPFDPSEVYDEAAAREWNWNSLIGLAIWLVQIWFVDPIGFWIIFENYSWINFSFLHIQIKFIVREFYFSMSRSKVTRGQIVISSLKVTRGHFKELWNCQENGIAAGLRILKNAISC